MCPADWPGQLGRHSRPINYFVLLAVQPPVQIRKIYQTTDIQILECEINEHKRNNHQVIWVVFFCSVMQSKKDLLPLPAVKKTAELVHA